MKYKFIVVDTEDDSAGTVKQIIFYDGSEYYEFDDPKKAVEFLNGKEFRIWAVNLEYDIANLFQDRLKDIQLEFGKSRLIYARYKKNYFYDTLNHFKLSVEKMGERINLKKLPFDPGSREYCRRDVEITYKFLYEMFSRYEKIGMKVKSTLPSSCLSFWKWKYRFPLQASDKDFLLSIRQAYYGGRTECFKLGKLKGDIRYIDINSMYPFCMKGEMPMPYIYRTGKIFEPDKFGITFCRVKSDLKYPILPYRSANGRLIFPNGEFKGAWANNELKYFQEAGGKVLKVYSSITYAGGIFPFDDFVDTFYGLRKQEKDDFLRDIYKLMMNSLYGKWGQGNERVYVKPVEKIREMRSIPNNCRIYKDLAVYTEEGDFPKHTNYIWSIYITARARIKLHELITTIYRNGDTPLYCDTDSVILLKTSKAEYKNSNDLGKYKEVGRFKEIDIRTCKMYQMKGLENDSYIRVKGIPNAEQRGFFATGSATFKKPLKIREALRRDLRPNLWLEHKKIQVEEYSKGLKSKNGDIKPFILK